MPSDKNVYIDNNQLYALLFDDDFILLKEPESTTQVLVGTLKDTLLSGEQSEIVLQCIKNLEDLDEDAINLIVEVFSHINNPEDFTTIFQKYGSHQVLQNICSNGRISNLLFPGGGLIEAFYEEVKKLLQDPKATESDKENTLISVVNFALKYNKPHLLALIRRDFPEEFISLKDSVDLSPEYQELLNEIHEDAESGVPIEFYEFGRITYDGLLLLCATIHEKKNSFNPVVLNCDNDYQELKTLLQFIKDNIGQFNNTKEPIVFIMKASHTVSGAITVTDNVVKISFLDSMGTKLSRYSEDVNELASEIFGDDYKGSKFILERQRQHAKNACAAFSFSDARRMSKNPALISGSLETDHSEFLPLLMSEQSSSVVTFSKKKSEHDHENTPINKKGDSFATFIKTNFKEDVVTGKKRNYYMDKKLERWRNKVRKFVEVHGESGSQDIEERKSKFSVNGFCAEHDPRKASSQSRRPGIRS